ncbi:unnamed protein product [Choristocarpus tenellus]
MRRVSFCLFAGLVTIAQPLSPCNSTGKAIAEIRSLYDVEQLAVNISCSMGTFSAVWYGELSLSTTLTVAEGTSLSIRGADTLASIDGGATLPLFDVNSGTLSLQGLILRRGNATDVAAEYVQGGAIRIVDGTLDVTGCTFESNEANESGGAIYANHSEVIVENSIFEECRVGKSGFGTGGGIHVNEGRALIRNSAIYKNFAGERGGGAWLNSGDFTVYNTTFVENMVGAEIGTKFEENEETFGQGGGLSVDTCEGGFYGGPCEIDLNLFQENFAGAKGGGLVVGGSDVHNNITIERCSFQNNSAGQTDPPFDDFPVGDGGALSVGGNFILLVVNSKFESNIAGKKGGAIISSSESELHVHNSEFNLNEARGDGGGAITVGSNSKLLVNSSNFSTNTAEESGGAINGLSSSTVVIQSGAFYENYADRNGGVITAQGIVLVSSGTFGGNTARINGGALYASVGANYTVSGGTFFLNRAQANGGSLYLGYDSEMVVSAGIFFDNKASNSGGFVFVNGNLKVTGGTYRNNSAEDGGFIFVARGYASCTGVTVENHEAVNGGVVYASKAAHVDWACNSTDSYGILGGVMYLYLGASISITSSSFTGITMPRGSAIFLLDSSLTVEKAVFEDTNRSSVLLAIQGNPGSVVKVYDSSFRGFGGEAVVFSGGELVLDGCDFSESVAQELVYSSYVMPPVLRNTVLGNLNYDGPISDGVTSQSAEFVNRAYTCADQRGGHSSLCSSVEDCLDGDMGVYCDCYTPDVPLDGEEVCFDGSSMLHLSTESSVGNFFSPDKMTADILLEADSSVETGIVWNMRVDGVEDIKGARLDVTWDIFPSTGVLMPGKSILVRVTGIAPLDLNGPLNTSFVVSNGPSVSLLVDNPHVVVQTQFFHCDKGLFWTDQGECRPCSSLNGAAEGVDCSEPGSTQKTLRLIEGFWRASGDSIHIKECMNKEACSGGLYVDSVDDYCLEGYQGPYCTLCMDSHGQGAAYTCHKCTSAFKTSMYVIMALSIFVLIIAGVLLGTYLVSGAAGVQNLEMPVSVLKRRDSPSVKMNPLYSARGGNAVNDIAPGKARSVPSVGQANDNKGFRQVAAKFLSRIPFHKIKIVVVVWQITSQFASITQVAYPPVLKKFFSVISVLNFDLSWILSASCVTGGIKFYNKLLLVTIAPLAILLFLGCTFCIGNKRVAAATASSRKCRSAPSLNFMASPTNTSTVLGEEKEDTMEDITVPSRESLQKKDLLGGNSFFRKKRKNEDWEKHTWQLYSRHINVLLISSYLLYTQICTVVFQTFACEEVDGGVSGESYLSADLRISCQSPDRAFYLAYSFIMILVYPVGVPLGFAVFLWYQKDSINPPSADEDTQHGGKYYIQAKQLEQREKNVRLKPTAFLWRSYRPGSYNYEVIECFRRLFLTGLLVVIIPHSSGQVAIGCMFAFLSLMLFELLRPHLDPSDRMLYRTGCLVIFFTNFLGLMIKAEVAVTESDESAIYAVLLIIANVFLLISVWCSTWVSLSAALRPKNIQLEFFEFDLSQNEEETSAQNRCNSESIRLNSSKGRNKKAFSFNLDEPGSHVHLSPA